MAKSDSKKDQGTELATQGGGMVVTDQMPEYLRAKQGSARGQENVQAEDLVIPRLEVIQDLSPCRKKSDPNYIEGAEEGLLYNNVTRELYGKDVLVIPVGFVKEYLLWKDRKLGGGFGGAFPTQQEAESARQNLTDEKGNSCADDYEVVDTNQQFCLLVKPDGGIEEIVVSMAKSKAKISRKWNSLIRIANTDSFGRVYQLSAVEDTNKQNQSFYNLSVKPAGYPSAEAYARAERMYKAIAAGHVTADRASDVEDTAGNGGASEF